jgi:hypothetical protein
VDTTSQTIRQFDDYYGDLLDGNNVEHIGSILIVVDRLEEKDGRCNSL